LLRRRGYHLYYYVLISESSRSGHNDFGGETRGTRHGHIHIRHTRGKSGRTGKHDTVRVLTPYAGNQLRFQVARSGEEIRQRQDKPRRAQALVRSHHRHNLSMLPQAYTI